jgi:hypothetical protein
MADETGEARSQTSRDETWPGAIRQLATSSLNSQKHRAREGLGEVARAIRQSADPLDHEGRPTAARYVRDAADRVERFATRLDEQSFGDMVQDVQAFARRQPVLFVGAALGLGLLGARFFKSSAEHSMRMSGATSTGGERTAAPGAAFNRSQPYYDADLPGAADL